MEWVFFTLLAVFLWSICSIIDKYVLKKYIKDPMIIMTFFAIFQLIFAFVVFVFQPVTIPPLNTLLFSLASGIAYFIFIFLYIKSLLVEEVSRVISLYAITPIFVLILSTIFLHEIFSLEKYAGIFMIVIGSILISLKKKTNFKLSRALFFMVIAAIFGAIYYILQKFVLNSLTYWNVFFWVRIGSFLLAPFILFAYYKPFIKTFRKNTIAGVYLSIVEILNAIGVYLIVIAYSIGYAALVNAFTEVQSLVVLLMATALSIFNPKIIKEELKGSTVLMKFVAIIMIIAGAILIS